MNTKEITFEEAEKYFNDKKYELLEIMFSEFDGKIEYQADYNQVVVWFGCFSICYQDSDMNGSGKGSAHWNNDGADVGLYELRDILKEDERFKQLIANKESLYKNEYLMEFIHFYCGEYAEKYKIDEMFEQ